MRNLERWAFVGVLSLASSAGADAGDAPAAAPAAPPAEVVLPIDRAARDGFVDVKGVHPGGYQTVDLQLTSKTTGPLTLDLAGRHLTPRTGNVQRLGLAHSVTPLARTGPVTPGKFVVTLAPGEKRTIRMHSCCMDAGKGCPGPNDVYGISSTPTPPKVEAALRWWVDHPKAPQGFVNAAIWQSNLALLENVPPAGPDSASELPPMPTGRFVSAYGGILYLLDDGALTSLDSEGVRRFHATGIWEAWPGADGLLAVGMAPNGRELWRFGETGDPPWVRLFPMDPAPTRALLRAPGGGVLVLQGSAATSALWVRPAGREERVPLSFAELEITAFDAIGVGLPDGSRGNAVVVVRHRGTPRLGGTSTANQNPRAPTLEVLDVDLATGKVTPRRTFWNARQLVPGPAGVFGVSPGNRLVRLEGERFVDTPFLADGLEIVAVGGTRVVVKTGDGRLLSVHGRTGRSEPLPPGALAAPISIDTKTDQVVWVEEGDARRWTPGRDEVEAIPFR